MIVFVVLFVISSFVCAFGRLVIYNNCLVGWARVVFVIVGFIVSGLVFAGCRFFS